MKSLQQAMNDILERQWPLKVCAELLDEKLRAQGVTLSQSKLNELAKRILDEKKTSIDLEIDENELSAVQIEFTEEDGRKAEEKMEQLSNMLPALLRDMTVRGTEVVLESMKRRWPKESRAQKRDMNRLRRNLDVRWGPALERLKMLCTISRELGSDINNALRPAGGGDRPQTFDLLIRSHARACQITEEVICLLGSGFADGAMARWRYTAHAAPHRCNLANAARRRSMGGRGILGHVGEGFDRHLRSPSPYPSRPPARNWTRPLRPPPLSCEGWPAAPAARSDPARSFRTRPGLSWRSRPTIRWPIAPRTCCRARG
jgi:hypothetical protein